MKKLSELKKRLFVIVSGLALLEKKAFLERRLENTDFWMVCFCLIKETGPTLALRVKMYRPEPIRR